ncbi:hypothetical protein BROUX41_001717 [Berkeleyomyces rouxiae]
MRFKGLYSQYINTATDPWHKNNKAEISDTDVSVRFKIGLHTFALFIDSLSLWSTISEQLSAIIKARYGATGLATFNNSIALPTTQKWRIVYAKPKNLQDGGDGWTPLKFDEETETPARSGLTDGCVLAFAVWPDTETRTPVDADFVVDMPPMDDDSNGDDMEDSRSEDPFDLATE